MHESKFRRNQPKKAYGDKESPIDPIIWSHTYSHGILPPHRGVMLLDEITSIIWHKIERATNFIRMQQKENPYETKYSRTS